MKYSFSILFIVLFFYQILLIFAASGQKQSNDQAKNQLLNDHFEDVFKLLRAKRQARLADLNSLIKRNDFNHDVDELDEQDLNSKAAKNQKKSKYVAFRPWGGKRASEKPFRTWGGKRSFPENLNQIEYNSKLNDYLKRFEFANLLLNELDSQNYD